MRLDPDPAHPTGQALCAKGRARALLNADIDRRVVVGEHGWWQAAPDANAPGYDPFSRQGSNYNLTVDPIARDPISGTTAHRSGRCEVSRIA